MALEEITRDEMQGFVAQLKEALYYHQQWHASLIRVLVCKLPGDKHDASPLAYKECRFGQWYFGETVHKLRNHAGFIALGDEHQRMHQLAAQLLFAAESGKPISSFDFDNFANALERLRLEISALERELEEMLYNHDTLTGAFTRFAILPALREQQELVKRKVHYCYIAMMDFDNFKSVNDSHGHQAGDIVLASSIRYLIRHLRPYDKVFRYGGEEFLLCLPATELMPGHERINQLAAGLSAMEIELGNARKVHISASFGVVALAPDVPVETSIDRADKALYAAKSAGKNCVRSWEAA